MSTIGYGEIYPVSVMEKIYGIIISFLACGVFAYAINTIGTVFQERAQRQTEYRKKKQCVLKFMNQRNISKASQTKVLKYMEYEYNQQDKEGNLQQGQEVLNQVSLSIRQEVYKEFYEPILKSSEIMSLYFPTFFLEKLCLCMKEMNFSEGEVIYSQGSHNSNLYYVNKGQLEIYIEQKKQFNDRLQVNNKNNIQFRGFIGTGEFFGYESFFAHGKEQTESIRSQKYSQVLYIEQSDMMKLLEEFPQQQENFTLISEALLQKNNIQRKCMFCNTNVHNIITCPLVHYTPYKEKLLSQYFLELKVEQIERQPFKRRTQIRNKNSLKSLKGNMQYRTEGLCLRIDLVQENHQYQKLDYIFENAYDLEDEEFVTLTPHLFFDIDTGVFKVQNVKDFCEQVQYYEIEYLNRAEESKLNNGSNLQNLEEEEIMNDSQNDNTSISDKYPSISKIQDAQLHQQNQVQQCSNDNFDKMCEIQDLTNSYQLELQNSLSSEIYKQKKSCQNQFKSNKNIIKKNSSPQHYENQSEDLMYTSQLEDSYFRICSPTLKLKKKKQHEQQQNYDIISGHKSKSNISLVEEELQMQDVNGDKINDKLQLRNLKQVSNQKNEQPLCTRTIKQRENSGNMNISQPSQYTMKNSKPIAQSKTQNLSNAIHGRRQSKRGSFLREFQLRNISSNNDINKIRSEPNNDHHKFLPQNLSKIQNNSIQKLVDCAKKQTKQQRSKGHRLSIALQQVVNQEREGSINAITSNQNIYYNLNGYQGTGSNMSNTSFLRLGTKQIEDQSLKQLKRKSDQLYLQIQEMEKDDKGTRTSNSQIGYIIEEFQKAEKEKNQFSLILNFDKHYEFIIYRPWNNFSKVLSLYKKYKAKKQIKIDNKQKRMSRAAGVNKLD